MYHTASFFYRLVRLCLLLLVSQRAYPRRNFRYILCQLLSPSLLGSVSNFRLSCILPTRINCLFLLCCFIQYTERCAWSKQTPRTPSWRLFVVVALIACVNLLQRLLGHSQLRRVHPAREPKKAKQVKFDFIHSTTASRTIQQLKKSSSTPLPLPIAPRMRIFNPLCHNTDHADK